MKRMAKTNRAPRRIGLGILMGLSALVLSGVTASEANAQQKPKRERTVVVQKKQKDRPVAVGRHDRVVGRHDGDIRPHVRAKRHARAKRHVRWRDRTFVTSTLCTRPWWASARRVEFGDRPYYFHAGFGVSFGGAALRVTLTDAAPCGYLYLDPVSGRTFRSVTAYKRFLRGNPCRYNLLTVVKIDF